MKALPLTLVLAAMVSRPDPAGAQVTRDRRSFVTVIAGTQTIPTLSTSVEFPLFGRAGTVETVRRRTTAPLVEIAAAHRLWRALGFGVGVLRTSVKQTATYEATVPVEGTAFQIFPVSDHYSGAERRETQWHFSVLWMAALNDKVSIDFSGGPSIVRARHDHIVAMTMPQFLFANPVIATDTRSAGGYHAGFGLRGRLVKNAGLAIRVRYTGGTADFPTGSHKVGGLQIGAGLALVF